MLSVLLIVYFFEIHFGNNVINSDIVKPSINLQAPPHPNRIYHFEEQPGYLYQTPVSTSNRPLLDDSADGYLYEKPTTTLPADTFNDEIPTTETDGKPIQGYNYDPPMNNTFINNFVRNQFKMINPDDIYITTATPDLIGNFNVTFNHPNLSEIIIDSHLGPNVSFKTNSERKIKHIYFYGPPLAEDDPPVYPYLPPVTSKPPLQADVPINSYGVPIPSNHKYFGINQSDDTVIIDVPGNSFSEQPPNTYIPPVNPLTKQLPNSKLNNLQIKILNMECMKSSSRNYFKVTLQTSQPLQNLPVVDSNSDNCTILSTSSRTLFNLNLMDSNYMQQCGVKNCALLRNSTQTLLCVNVRFPVVMGLKLPEDILLTLQCRTQQRIASQFKYLNIHPMEMYVFRFIYSVFKEFEKLKTYFLN